MRSPSITAKSGKASSDKRRGPRPLHRRAEDVVADQLRSVSVAGAGKRFHVVRALEHHPVACARPGSIEQFEQFASARRIPLFSFLLGADDRFVRHHRAKELQLLLGEGFRPTRWGKHRIEVDRFGRNFLAGGPRLPEPKLQPLGDDGADVRVVERTPMGVAQEGGDRRMALVGDDAVAELGEMVRVSPPTGGGVEHRSRAIADGPCEVGGVSPAVSLFGREVDAAPNDLALRGGLPLEVKSIVEEVQPRLGRRDGRRIGEIEAEPLREVGEVGCVVAGAQERNPGRRR